MGSKSLPHSLLLVLMLIASTVAALAQGPIIDVWYGDSQKFGHIGNPQKWVNILGNVSDVDGVKQINYTLNGGEAVVLSVGPDNRRLQNKGDFNVDLLSSDLIDGNNELIITAIDSVDDVSSITVNVSYTDGKYWRKDYQFQWDTVTNIQNTVQIVDGKWELTANGIRTSETGYDRLIAIGDTSWTNYQIEIPITVHDIEAPISELGGKDFGLGLILRWTGHSDKPASAAGWQPKSGFLPLGEIGWFNWPESDTSNTQLNFLNITNQSRNPFTVEKGKTYIFKFQVYSTPFVGHTYKIKVWEDGNSEPDDWFLENTRAFDELSFGSLLFVAHHVDATFGNPVTQELGPGPYISAMFSTTISNLNGLEAQFDGSDSFSQFGNIISYNWDFGDGNQTSGEVINHTFTSTGIYTVSLEVTDAQGNSAELSRQIYVNADGTILKSDDFNSKNTNQDLWAFVNPKGDASHTISGYNTGNSVVQISVPGGTSHDVWTGGNESVRLMQNTVDDDFEVEVKFESVVTGTNQIQGVLIEQDSSNLIRFDFYSQNDNVRAFCATFINGYPEIQYNATFSDVADTLQQLYLRITRIGERWTMACSSNGETWQFLTNFDHEIAVLKSGIFAANAGSNPSAHTVIADYYFNTSSPIVPEDANGVRITEAVDEGIDCYKIETAASVYYFDKQGGGFTSIVDVDGNDWISFAQGGGSAGEYRGIPNTGELHPGYTGGSTTTNSTLNTWLEVATIETSRNGESAIWDFYPTYARMNLNSIGGDDGAYWILYEGTPGGQVNSNDSLFLSNNSKYSVGQDDPFGENDIINTSDAAVGSEWAYVTDGNLDRSIFLAITDDEIKDNYFQMEDNMTVLGFGRNKGAPPVQHRDDVGSMLVLGLVESKEPLKVKNAIDTAWKSSLNQFPVPSFTYEADLENELLIKFDASNSDDPDGNITQYVWEFGDESTGSGLRVDHEYASAGSFDVRLLLTDNMGDTASIIKTIEVGGSDLAFISDDFDDSDLNTEIWEFINPAQDGSYEILDEETSFVLGLTVPAGTRHEIWENTFTPVGVAQEAKNIDFEIEAKFESTVSERFQEQGIMVLGASGKILRIETFTDGTDQFLFVASVENGTSKIFTNTVISFGQVIYLKVNRSANTWIIEYSTNGENWNEGVSFDYPMTVQKVGAYGGNAGSNPPAHLAKLDYFFNNADKIDPEDPNSARVTGLDEIFSDYFTVYPNPAGSNFNVKFKLQSESDLLIRVFNSKGQLVKIDQLDQLSHGEHEVLFNSSEFNSGIHILNITVSSDNGIKNLSKKIIIE